MTRQGPGGYLLVSVHQNNQRFTVVIFHNQGFDHHSVFNLELPGRHLGPSLWLVGVAVDFKTAACLRTRRAPVLILLRHHLQLSFPLCLSQHRFRYTRHTLERAKI